MGTRDDSVRDSPIVGDPVPSISAQDRPSTPSPASPWPSSGSSAADRPGAGRPSPATPERDFQLGDPALVCRWRLAGGTLPLANRHLRALSKRQVNGKRMTPELVAWAKQHVELTLPHGSQEHPDGVLMLVVDSGSHAAMTVGPYHDLQSRTLESLLRRAAESYREAEATGVNPESLWIATDGGLVWGTERSFDTAGCASLIEGLAHTMGIRVARRSQLHAVIANGLLPFDEAFLVSDEHGVVVAEDHPGPRGTRMAESYAYLLEKARQQQPLPRF